MSVTVLSGGPACILHPLISSVLVADTSGKTGVVGIGSNGWRVEDAMINGGQAVDTVGNKNIKTPQSLSPAHTPWSPTPPHPIGNTVVQTRPKVIFF